MVVYVETNESSSIDLHSGRASICTVAEHRSAQWQKIDLHSGSASICTAAEHRSALQQDLQRNRKSGNSVSTSPT
jgi:hypothetical protein